MIQCRNANHVVRGLAAIAVLLTGYLGVPNTVQATEVRHPSTSHPTGDNLIPTGKGWGKIDLSGRSLWQGRKSSQKSSSNNGIFYHGGPLILNTANVYYIWYGSWNFSSDNTNTILNSFGNSIGGTPYFNINTTYYDGNNTHAIGLVALPKTIVDTGSYGSTLSDSDIQNIVANALANGLPTDPNGVYFVLTSKEVTETSGFCTQYCAWHTHGTINGQDIKYGFIGNPAQCPSACSVQSATPNGNFAADSMANLIAHELAESVTDSDLDAWYDRRGYENADKCAWKFGTTQTGSNGAKYNVSFGGRNWLLQQNWINAGGGYCTLTN
jgi:hypothetical protein